MFSLQGTHHTIRGLLFACKYRVAVAMKADQGSEAVAWVTTPTCSSIRVRRGKALTCNTEGKTTYIYYYKILTAKKSFFYMHTMSLLNALQIAITLFKQF